MLRCRPQSLTLFALALTGCASDALSSLCVTSGVDFDIDEVSTLEDNWGWAGLRDAIVLDAPQLAAATQPGQEPSWRVSGVDVLVMIPSSEFAGYADVDELTVEIFDQASLTGAASYVRTQRLVKSALTWSAHSFDDIPTGAATFPSFETAYRMAWWPFDFSGLIPESGMRSARYAVGLSWREADAPLVGYSNFDRSCDDNWTNYDDAYPPHGLSGTGWASNGERFDGNICNWPMLRVSVERSEACRE